MVHIRNEDIEKELKIFSAIDLDQRFSNFFSEVGTFFKSEQFPSKANLSILQYILIPVYYMQFGMLSYNNYFTTYST